MRERVPGLWEEFVMSRSIFSFQEFESRPTIWPKLLSLIAMFALISACSSKEENEKSRSSSNQPTQNRQLAQSAPEKKPSGTEHLGKSRRERAPILAEESMDYFAGGTGIAAYAYDMEPSSVARYEPEFNTEAYDRISENEFQDPNQKPLSTFSIDVDTASYANVRRYLSGGSLPPKDAVRIEELVNYFDYDYPDPAGNEAFSVNAEVATCPWKPEHKLVHIGLRGKNVHHREIPARNLVFLIDVSGSMQDANKLPLLKESLKLLTNELTEKDRVAIVVYAGAAGLVLPSTPGDRKHEILGALDALSAGGSTAGGAGIELAYKVAQQNFVKDAVNRVILATDGDFNVGVSDRGSLTRLIEDKRKSGVFLSVFGLGMGNYKDSALENLADKGNGNYAYIDTLAEARKVFVTQLNATLLTIAKDVKIQVEFNPARVQAYRLIGYENRVMADRDFNDDTKDAGEIGAGHTVTALYEVVPVGVELDVPQVSPLKYQRPSQPTERAASNELLTVKLRHKLPDADKSTEQSFALMDAGKSFAQASTNLRFSAAVAGFGMLLRDSEHKGALHFSDVQSIARDALGKDPYGYRGEFLRLVSQAGALKRES